MRLILILQMTEATALSTQSIKFSILWIKKEVLLVTTAIA